MGSYFDKKTNQERQHFCGSPFQVVKYLILLIIHLAMQAKIEVKLEELPKRVKGGYLKCVEKKVLTNYYPVAIKPLTDIYIFKVVFDPPIMNDNRVLRKRVLGEAFASIKTQIPYPVMGGMNIYSATEPKAKEGIHDATGYKIHIKLVKSFDVKTNPKILLLFLNNGIRNIMSSMDYIQIGQTGKYFNVKQRKNINNQLSLFPGYRANFLFGESGLYLRIDPVNKVVQNKTVLQTIDEIYSRNSAKDKFEKRDLVKQALINKIVMTNYGRTRYVRIADVEFIDMKEILVDGKEGLTIYKYYTEKYNLQVNSRQPLLRIENKNKNDARVVYMLPEYCLMTGLPDDIDQLRRKKVSEFTIVDPMRKYQAIDKLARQIKGTDEQKALEDLGIKISHKPQEVAAKCLQNPTIMLGNGNKVERGKESGFKIFPKPVYQSPSSLEISIIFLEGTDIHGLYDVLDSTGDRLNLRLKIQKVEVKGDPRTPNELKHSTIKGISYAESKFSSHCYLIVLRDCLKPVYNEIKEYCLKKNLLSQIVLQGNLRKTTAKSIITNILVQVGAKLGGIPWRTTFPKKIENKAMLLSFDTSKAGKKRKVAGVGTMNSSFTVFASECEDCQDIANKFQKMAKITLSLANRYVKLNKNLPEELVILTDSCPKNQIKMFYDYYIPQVEQELNLIYARLYRKEVSRQTSCVIKLTIIQVKDLTNERFFAVQGDRLRNPEPGTLISTQIVSQNYDFFLIPQYTRVGCTIPIHFNVIYSKSKFEEGELQELMYYQCFSYYNWTGSIKIPSLLQYAKKCAKFSSQNMKQFNVTDEWLTNKLYFI